MRLRLLTNTGDDLRLDFTLVVATNHTEETLLTPVLVPVVDKEPVLGAVFYTITKQLDSVITNKVTTDVMVDTAGVHQEIFVNSKAGFARAIHSKLSHDIVMTLDIIDILGKVLLLLPLLTILTLARARRSGIVLRGARILAARDVVVARGERIRLAFGIDNTVLVPVDEGIRRLATIAATTTRASKNISSAKNEIVIMLSHASTITHSSSRANSPAGTTSRLIRNSLHGSAVVMVTGIIRLRSSQPLTIRVGVTIEELGRVSEALRSSTKQGANLIMREVSNRRRKRSSPQLGLLVNRTNKVHSANGGSAAQHSCDSDSNKTGNKSHRNSEKK